MPDHAQCLQAIAALSAALAVAGATLLFFALAISHKKTPDPPAPETPPWERDPADPYSYPKDEPVPGTAWWEGTVRCAICGHSARAVVPIPNEWSEPIVPLECSACHNLTANVQI